MSQVSKHFLEVWPQEVGKDNDRPVCAPVAGLPCEIDRLLGGGESRPRDHGDSTRHLIYSDVADAQAFLRIQKDELPTCAAHDDTFGTLNEEVSDVCRHGFRIDAAIVIEGGHDRGDDTPPGWRVVGHKCLLVSC